MTDDLSLTLVEKALSVRLAVQLGDRKTARVALSEVHRLVPLLRLAVQQMPDRPDDEGPDDHRRDLAALLAAKYPSTAVTLDPQGEF